MKPMSNISVIDGEWTVEEVARQATEESQDDEPFYVMDLGEVVQRYQCWRNLMPRVEPFYAVKCNEDKMLLRTLASLGAGFDCASRQEIDLVTGIGVPPERIIYANPTKMASHVRHAASIGVTTTTFDSIDELIKIKDIMPHAKLVLRIRCDAKLAQVSLGTKFGCDPTTEAPQLLRMASHLGLEVIGVCFHVGSGAKEFGAYARGVRHCAELFKLGEAIGFEMRLVDIGGGYSGDLQSSLHEYLPMIGAPGVAQLIATYVNVLEQLLSDSNVKFAPQTVYLELFIYLSTRLYGTNLKHLKFPGFFKISLLDPDLVPTLREVSVVVNEALERYFPDDSVRVIAEPGQYFACAAYTLATCVFAKRQVLKCNEKHTMYYMSDGVFGSFLDCAVIEVDLAPPLLVTACNGKQESSTLWGPTCDSLDCVLPYILLPPLPVGSWLLFRNRGAYTRSVATTYHGFPRANIQYIVDRSIWSILKDSKQFSDVDFEYKLFTSKKI